MAVEIYTIPSNEGGYDPNKIDEFNELQIYLSQIRNILNLNKGSVLGASDMGIDLESCVFDIQIETNNLKEMISQQILTFCTYSSKFSTVVDVKFSEGKTRDMCFIDIVINNKRQMQFRIL